MDKQFVLGTINFTNWIHITVSKVSNESVVLWEDWVDVPLTNYTFIVPGLDMDNYYMKLYDADTDTDIGTLVNKFYFNAAQSEYEYELRFYEGGNLPEGATLDGAGQLLTDPYLDGKTIHLVSKEGFRELDQANEYTYTGTNELQLNGSLTLADGEKLLVILKNKVGVVSTLNYKEFAGVIDVSDETYTIAAADKNKRFRCVGTAVSQTITAPLLAALNDGDFIYIDNTVTGLPPQVKILFAGSDKLLYNGFDLPVNELTEFWAGHAEAVKLAKNGSYWEVIGYSKAGETGERIPWGGQFRHDAIPETEEVYSTEGLPRFKWWLENKLSAFDKIVDDAITGGGWVRPAGKEAWFFVNSDYSFFRPPATQVLFIIYFMRKL